MNTENSKQTCSGSGLGVKPDCPDAGTGLRMFITKMDEVEIISAILKLGYTSVALAMIGLNPTKMKLERRDG